MKISVIIPVYNEAETIAEIVARVQAVQIATEIIIVNDGSTDDTGLRLTELEKQHDNVKVLQRDHNLGKGASLREGFAAATGDVLVIQDADLEYNPVDYDKLLEPILSGEADVVYGSRFLGWPRRVLMFWHTIGNRMLTLLSNMLTNLNLTDMETGYKVFRREVLDGMKLRSNRFGFEPEFTAKVAKRKYRIYEVPVRYAGRTYAEGKKISWKDGLVALFCIIWFRLAD